LAYTVIFVPTHLFSTAPIIKHSLATPLTNIITNSELAVQNLQLETSYSPETELQKVLLNAQYMKSVIMLQEKRQQYIFSPLRAIQEILQINHSSKLKKGLVTRVAIPTKKHLTGNKLLFQEMIVCLLNNAYESYKKRTLHKMVFFSATDHKKNCKITIVDAGKGMNWWEKHLSTYPFKSLKQKHSGLGLYFVKNTLEKDFNGKLAIKSQKNKGTTVTLSLPFYKT
jgi:K+-sensing histidine kinase KdpD